MFDTSVERSLVDKGLCSQGFPLSFITPYLLITSDITRVTGDQRDSYPSMFNDLSLLLSLLRYKSKVYKLNIVAIEPNVKHLSGLLEGTVNDCVHPEVHLHVSRSHHLPFKRWTRTERTFKGPLNRGIWLQRVWDEEGFVKDKRPLLRVPHLL